MLMQDLIGDYYRPSYRTKQLYAELDADEIMEGQIHNNKGVRAVERSTKVAVTFGANVEHESKYLHHFCHNIIPGLRSFMIICICMFHTFRYFIICPCLFAIGVLFD